MYLCWCVGVYVHVLWTFILNIQECTQNTNCSVTIESILCFITSLGLLYSQHIHIQCEAIGTYFIFYSIIACVYHSTNMIHRVFALSECLYTVCRPGLVFGFFLNHCSLYIRIYIHMGSPNVLTLVLLSLHDIPLVLLSNP